NLLPEIFQVRAGFISPMQDAALSLFHDALFGLAVGELLFLDAFLYSAAESFEQCVALLFIARIGQQSSDKRRAACRQRPPSGPDVQGRDVPMPHVLFVNGID